LDNQLELVKRFTRIQRTALAALRWNMPEIENPVIGTASKIEPELMTKAETAHLLAVSTRSIDNMMRDRRISYVKLSAKIVRFPRREILKHIQENLTVHAQGSARN
jgi:predicted DNA-binding transcriptional regulator AlpA